MRERLSDRSLPGLPDTVARPAYDRSRVTPGIVHLGVGAFHRAHQAVYVDECIAAGETGWGIVGASLRSPATHDALEPQDGLYTLAVRGRDEERLNVVGSIHSMLVAPRDPAALLDTLCDRRVRVVTLTITEKAYFRKPTGGLDASDPAISADLTDPARPRTAHGFLVEALSRRRGAGHPPFTVLCCDNLPANGATLHGLLVAFASHRDVDLARFVEDEVSCPSCMVDRIVPATTDADRAAISRRLGVDDAWPVITEPFRQWVIEDVFPAGRPSWERSGVQMVKDVRPFEEMKLRLLNGSHSALAYVGLLCGHQTVSAAFADPAIRRFVRGLWAEAISTLPVNAGLDPIRYTGDLALRYTNDALVHRTAQIANDGSQKLPQRIVAAALDRLRAGAAAHHLALAIAAWIRAAEERGRSLPANLFTDPLDARLADIAASREPVRESVAAVFAAAGFAVDSTYRVGLEALAAAHLETLREGKGIAGALSGLSSGAPFT